MIYLRCPHHGCPIEVADDMLGARIRCPHCAQLLFVEPQDQPAGDTPPQPTAQGVHAGMPPLAAMLGIREGRGSAWGEPRAVRANMTDLDWQALAAFEQVVHAVVAVRTAIGFGVVAAAITGLFWLAATQATSWDTEFATARLVSRLVSLIIVAISLALMAIGGRRLGRVRLGMAVGTAVVATLAIALVFAVNVLLILQALWHSDYRDGGVCPVILVIAFLLIAASFAGRAFLLMQRARTRVSPHAIRHRLTEALDYLDWIEREDHR